MHACSLVFDSVTPCTVACRALLSTLFPGKITGVGCHFLLQGIFLTQGSNPSLFCLLHWQEESFSLCHLECHLGIWGYASSDSKETLTVEVGLNSSSPPWWSQTTELSTHLSGNTWHHLCPLGKSNSHSTQGRKDLWEQVTHQHHHNYFLWCWCSVLEVLKTDKDLGGITKYVLD